MIWEMCIRDRVLKVGRKVLIKTDILEKFMEANEGRDLRDKGNAVSYTHLGKRKENFTEFTSMNTIRKRMPKAQN